MTAYKDIKQIIHAQTNLVQFESEIGIIENDIKVLSHLHIDTFVKGQETELEAFCTLHNILDDYTAINAIWNPEE